MDSGACVGSTGAVDATTARIARLAERWYGQRTERQARRSLDRADFDALEDAGFLRSAVPTQQGGEWKSVASSTRPVCDALRALASADPSVTLVAAMHPAVLGDWLTTAHSVRSSPATVRPDSRPACRR